MYSISENRGPKKVVHSFNQTYRNLAPYLGLGTQLAVTMVVLTFIGYYLDDYFHLKPILTIIGAFLGAGTGLYNFIRNVLFLSNKEKQNKKI